MESAIRKNDAVITAYRAHGWTYVRGVSVLGVLAELTGRQFINTIDLYLSRQCLHFQMKMMIWKLSDST